MGTVKGYASIFYRYRFICCLSGTEEIFSPDALMGLRDGHRDFVVLSTEDRRWNSAPLLRVEEALCSDSGNCSTFKVRLICRSEEEDPGKRSANKTKSGMIIPRVSGDVLSDGGTVEGSQCGVCNKGQYQGS